MKASQERLVFWDVKEGRCGKPSHYCKSRLYSSCSHFAQGPPGDPGEPGDPGQDGDQVSSKLMKAHACYDPEFLSKNSRTHT